jgi:preprotein translocase subunit Sec61beta
MDQEITSTRARLTTPRAAAVAGILFSVLLIICLVLIRISVPADPRDAGAWLAGSASKVALALNLLPFSGVAFLWFIGVVRDRLGEYEDRLFSTVFLGSGLLFLAMLFSSAAMAGGVITAFQSMPQQIIDTGLYGYGRATTYELMNTYAIKMAGVFMLSSCTLFLRLKLAPRWMVYLGYALALLLLLSIGLISWISLVFPLWTLLISVYILIQNYRRKAAPAVS